MPTTTTVLWAGGLAPEAYVLVLTVADLMATADLSAVSAADLQVQDPGGTIATWTATTAYDAAAGTLTLTHVLGTDPASPEITKAGRWSVYARLTVAGGTVRSFPRALEVKGTFAILPT